MKKFEAPSMDLEKLEVEDLITTSSNCTSDCTDDNPVCDVDAGIFRMD